MTDVLLHLRAEHRRALQREALAWALGCVLGGLGGAVILAQWGWTRSSLALLATAAVAAASGWAWQWQRLRQAADLQFPAQLAERLAPELGTGASAAVNLAERMAAPGEHFSRQLVTLHLEHTAQKLSELDLTARLKASRRRPMRQAGGVLTGAALWAGILLITLQAGRARLQSLILDPRAAHLSDVPLAGDIHLIYHYPQYTGLTSRVVEGGDGSIQAVIGTDVELQAVADVPLRKALLRVENMTGAERQDVPMVITSERKVAAHLPVLRDGRYRFVFTHDDGDVLEDRQNHAIRGLLDAFPEVHMDEPAQDVELHDNQVVGVHWHAKDDFGVSEVTLVVERQAVEPVRIPLTGATAELREGTYRWSVAALHLEAGKEARFYVEALDNDAIAGPKRAVSVSRRLVVFSARQHHEDMIAKEHIVLDWLVDWLGAELETPFAADAKKGSTAWRGQDALVERMGQGVTLLHDLLEALRSDRLSKEELQAAFHNIQEHVETARSQRALALATASKATPENLGRVGARVAALQVRDIKQVEQDIIYLDDLLAIARIDELKTTAKDLLAAQRDLQGLLQEYKQTQNPALRAQLEQRISDLRQKMMDLLTKMGDIKKTLPGEYRNMEAASMLRLDDELGRLEKTLKEGNLDAAAQQLEQLANMVENMVKSINDAEDEYGGDRYKEIRGQLAQFAEEFKQLENEQQALSQRSDEMLKAYRKKAIERAGNNMENFVQKARDHVRRGLQELDGIGESAELARLFDRDLDAARQSLLDLDALLAHRDFAEARQVAQNATVNGESLMSRLQNGPDRYPGLSQHELDSATQNSVRADAHAREVANMLDKLFPEANQVLSPEQMAQMQRMGRKQQSLEGQAQALQNKMEQLAGELPLFGGEPRANLEGARGEMGQAARDIQNGELPGGAGHGKRAVDQLGKLREALERASQGGGKGGMPLPLGMGPSHGPNGDAWGGDNNHEEVEIPKFDRNRASPRFRQDLLEAAKQKPPAHFEDAVRRYYEELIR